MKSQRQAAGNGHTYAVLCLLRAWICSSVNDWSGSHNKVSERAEAKCVCGNELVRLTVIVEGEGRREKGEGGNGVSQEVWAMRRASTILSESGIRDPFCLSYHPKYEIQFSYIEIPLITYLVSSVPQAVSKKIDPRSFFHIPGPPWT
jgi:hypothetical protein